ncbi:hypothetical protein JYT74_02995 [Crocinitomix catalasitica]|nr:hypothetical protein [Crocinitomix catalasitica]
MLKRSQLLLAIFLCLSLQTSHSQNAVRPVTYHWGFSGSIDASYRFVYLNDYQSEAGQEYKSDRDLKDRAQPRFTIGADFCWELNRKWAVTTGVYLAWRGYRNRTDYDENSPNANSTGLSYTYISNNSYQSIDFPIVISKLIFITQRLAIDLNLGYIGSYFFGTLNRSTLAYHESGWTHETLWYSLGEGDFLFEYQNFVQGGLSFRREGKHDRILKFGPEFKFCLNKNKTNDYGGERYYTVGFKTSLLFGRRANFRQ